MKRLRTLFFTLAAIALLSTLGRAASLSLSVKDASGGYAARTVQTVSLVFDGKTLESDIPAFLLDSRTMVPVRVIAEQLGAAVTWKQDSQQVQIENGQTSITLTIGSASAQVNGKTVQLYNGVPATMAAHNGLTRTMVPLRFISDQLGASVAWDAENATVTLSAAAEKTYDMTAPRLADGVVSITTGSDAEPNIFTLPGRVVADFPSGVLTDSSFGSIKVDGSVIASVRYNQYDHGYDVSRVARVVFDLKEGFTRDDLTIAFSGGVLRVSQNAAAEIPPVEPPSESKAPLIVLDAGHGGKDTGAPYYGIDEKDVVLQITHRTGKLLEEAGYRVEYTRSDDTYVSLAARAEQANTQQADIFVSVHANAFPQKTEVNGLETYYLVGGTRAKVLATRIHDAVLQSTGASDRGTRTANFYVLRNTDMPAVLVETGYMTNEAECRLLASDEYQQMLAQGIANGIAGYLGPAA